MIAKTLPRDYYLYVKEHPQQTELQRDFNFYKQLAEDYRNVKFIKTGDVNLSMNRNESWICPLK